MACLRGGTRARWSSSSVDHAPDRPQPSAADAHEQGVRHSFLTSSLVCARSSSLTARSGMHLSTLSLAWRLGQCERQSPVLEGSRRPLVYRSSCFPVCRCQCGRREGRRRAETPSVKRHSSNRYWFVLEEKVAVQYSTVGHTISTSPVAAVMANVAIPNSGCPAPIGRLAISGFKRAAPTFRPPDRRKPRPTDPAQPPGRSLRNSASLRAQTWHQHPHTSCILGVPLRPYERP